jgi:hypothetical protein
MRAARRYMAAGLLALILSAAVFAIDLIDPHQRTLPVQYHDTTTTRTSSEWTP